MSFYILDTINTRTSIDNIVVLRKRNFVGIKENKVALTLPPPI